MYVGLFGHTAVIFHFFRVLMFYRLCGCVFSVINFIDLFS